MNKFLNYISIALIAFTLFSCDKNEWTPEKETEFKKGVKESLESKGKGLFTEDQINYISDCSFEKLKSRNIKPNDMRTPGTILMMKQMGKECAQEAFIKKPASGTDNSWNPKTEESYKAMLRTTLLKTGAKSEDVSFITDCFINKMKEQNLGPADLQNPKNGDLVQKIGKECGEGLMKKK